VLKGAVVLAALPLAGFTSERRHSPVPADPFTLGVASGEPVPDGVVIWTRLAPRPLADDGLGGMPARPVDVEWEVAADERFTRIVQRGYTTAAPEAAHSVHVEITGLRPGAGYHYRFRADGYISNAGRTSTAPAPGSLAPLTMCVASCSNYENGWFTAYRRLADEHPDLVVHLGDYQYEYAAGNGNVRNHIGPEAVTLANYRQRYAQYKTDPDLQAAHAAAPWLAVFDDHEVANNWADDGPDKPEPAFFHRRAAALQAYYENMPLRRSSIPNGVHMQLYRRQHWGALATFHMLDTRQYRTDQPCGDEFRSDCVERLNPFASLTGADQERWLLHGFQQSRAHWDLLGQQVFFSQVELTQGPGRGFNPDAWDGYAANRDRIVAGLANSPVRNA
jgi:alkaline phosphatase D